MMHLLRTLAKNVSTQLNGEIKSLGSRRIEMLLGSNESKKKPTRRSSDATLQTKGLGSEIKKERSNSVSKF